MKKNKRTATVFVGLLGVLTVTSAVLLAVAPTPLTPDALPASATLMATAPSDTRGPASVGNVPVQPGRWQYIYIRHSKTSQMDLRQPTERLGDHFVILPGGERAVQMTPRWVEQRSALPPAGAKEIHPACISIVLVGDLDRTVPTPEQLARTTQLVRLLQETLQIPASNVLLVDQRDSAAGHGRFFPAAAFRESLRP
ncbi:MAG: hypothetical protein ACK4PI_03260 [Tepidisphaerales bacterium]